MAKESKSEALKKKLGNVVCAECGSKKHKTKDHEDKEESKENKKEINGDQE